MATDFRGGAGHSSINQTGHNYKIHRTLVPRAGDHHVMSQDMKTKSLHDLDASLSVISTNVAAYHTGNAHAYRPIAVELRKLLCDTIGKTDNSLMKRLLPDFMLRPLAGNQNKIDEHTALYIPGQISFDGRGGSSLSQFFNENAPSLILDEWLEQKLFDFTTTIRTFIRSVADKEGAHSDQTYNKVLAKTKSVILANDELTAQAILAIGRHVVKTLAIRMVNDSIDHIGAYITQEYDRVGRGVAVLDLTEFARHFSQGISIKYVEAPTAEGYFQRDRDLGKREAAKRIIQDYQASDFCILLVVDLNGELWLYQQRLRMTEREHR